MMGIYILYIIPFVLLQTVFGAVEIQFNVKENPKEYLEGADVSVMCYLSESVDNANLEWYDNKDVLITNTNPVNKPYIRSLSSEQLLLKLGDASSENSGNYKCKAVANEVPLEKIFHVVVKEALKFRDCPLKQIGILGQPSEIKCTAYGGQLTVVTFWAKEGSDLSADSNIQQSSNSLKIKDTSTLDEGKYIYNAISNSDGQSGEKTIIFVVYSAPKIVEPVTQTESVVGQPATLFCKAKGIPDPVIEWRKEGSTNILTTTDRLRVSTNKEGGDVQGILNITSVIKDDEALYTCTAKNEASDENLVVVDEKSAQLTVRIPPTIEKADDGKGKENGPANLVCTARGDPIPQMIWIKEKTGDRFSPGTTDDGKTVKQVEDNTPGNLGATLTLSFTSLQHSDAGEYKCEAVNKAATASKIVNLDVEYKPNFNDQGPTTFYNWENNDSPYIICTANGNPVPSFRWKKGDQEIRSTDPYYEIMSPEVDPENPHRAVSKLKVDISQAQDKSALFGEYTCIATNIQNESELKLSMVQAESPGKPTVDIRYDDASLIEFWLEGPTVKGPDVSHYTVSYKVKGSNDEPTVMTVAKEYRDHIDTSRKYTVLRVEGLKPSTIYVFNFFAKNDVGTGPAREVEKTTKAVRVPDTPKLDDTPMNSGKPTSILVKWSIPSNGGAQILEYRLTYQRVNVKTNNTSDNTAYKVDTKIGKPSSRTGIKDPSVLLDNLLPGSFYEIKVSAVNQKGEGLPATKVVRTQIAESVPGASTGESGGLSTAAIIGIVIGIFFLLFIIVDVTCYIKNNCGILMSIREKVGGGREEGYAVAKTEDVENLAKKDELTEEVKAAEEGELALAETQDEKKEPLLSEEQKVDTVDEGKPEEKKEFEPEEKETANTDQAKIESPKTEQAPTEPAKQEDIPAADDQPSSEKADKPQE